MDKKMSFGKTIIHIDLNGDIYKIGSIPLEVWEEFENMGHSADSILNGSNLNLAKVSRDFIVTIIKKHNKNIDVDDVYTKLSNLTIEDLTELFNIAIDIDKSLIINPERFENLSDEDKENLKKKMKN